jgi:hypothetical protein
MKVTVIEGRLTRLWSCTRSITSNSSKSGNGTVLLYENVSLSRKCHSKTERLKDTSEQLYLREFLPYLVAMIAALNTIISSTNSRL